jgi:hypothetical protein
LTEQTNCLKKYMYHTYAHIHRCSEMDKITSVVLINALRSCSKLKGLSADVLPAKVLHPILHTYEKVRVSHVHM